MLRECSMATCCRRRSSQQPTYAYDTDGESISTLSDSVVYTMRESTEHPLAERPFS